MKYWAYINNEILGPYEKEELIKLPQFTNSTLLCPQTPVGEKTEEWKEAASFPEISAMISNTSARSMAANPTDSGFNNPFHNYGNIEIKSIDENASAPAVSPSPSPLDPISLSQISKRQENFFKKDEPAAEQPKNGEQENTADPSVSAPLNSFLSTSPSSNINEINLEMPKPAADISPAPAEKKEIDLGGISLDGKNENGPAVEQGDKDGIQGIVSGEISLPPIEPLPATDSAVANQPQTTADIPAPSLEPLPALENPSLQPLAGDIAIDNSPIEVSQQPLPASEVIKNDLKPEPAQAAPAPSIFSGDSEKIIALIEKFASSSASKDDVSMLKSYLDSKIEILNNRINSFDGEGIRESIKSIENKLSSIESKMSSSAVSSKPSISPSSIQIDPNYDTAVMDKKEPSGNQKPPEKPVAPLSPQEPKPVAQPKKEEPKKESGPSVIGRIMKIALKVILSVLLIAGIFIALSLALRSAGIIDVTGYMPFIPPAKKAANKASEKELFQVQPSTFALQAEISTQSVSAESVVQQGKDLSEEVVYFARTYVRPKESKSLENLIIENAVAQKLDAKSITWKARKMDENVYHVFAEFPGKKEPVDYVFEVNYKDKSVRPSNDWASLVMIADADPNAPKDVAIKAVPAVSVKGAAKAKKGSKQRKASKPVTKPAAKKEETKPADKPKEDEEYVYEYEDEGEQEYLMPGIPKK
ncbi:MAG: hypothetical protein Fur0012_03700 [Elusimicrobiota bacterium]